MFDNVLGSVSTLSPKNIVKQTLKNYSSEFQKSLYLVIIINLSQYHIFIKSGNDLPDLQMVEEDFLKITENHPRKGIWNLSARLQLLRHLTFRSKLEEKN